MKNKLLFILFFSGFLSQAQVSQNCVFGVTTEETTNGSNITMGGDYEYSIASDFDVPFGKILSVSQLKFNVLKNNPNVNLVKVNILESFEGKPGDIIESFVNLVPISQTLMYSTVLPDLTCYEIVVNFPTSFDLPKGKYYIEIQASSTNGESVFWEINNQETITLGRFDFSKFGDENWFGGFSYYDHVFDVIGNCTETGENIPNYDAMISFGNESNNHEAGINMSFVSLADDFIVPENTIFSLSKIKFRTLQLGNIVNTSISIRNSINNAPGEIIYSVNNFGPKTENFNGYFPVTDYPLEVAAVDSEFEFEELIELTEGRYFIELKANPVQFSDYFRWETTTSSAIGSDAFQSFDNGLNWNLLDGQNFVFDVYGFSDNSLGLTENEKLLDFKYFPNPLEDILYLESNLNITEVTFYNILGQTIYETQSENKIDVSFLENGVYNVKVSFENGLEKNFKVIK